jgi:hypothetical protein
MADDDLRDKYEKAVAAVVDGEAVAFAPSFDLRKKIGLKGPAKELFPPERIEAAQEIVVQAAADFFASNENQRLDMLEALWKWRDDDAYGTTALELMSNKASALRSQAESLGYMFIGHLCARISAYCRGPLPIYLVVDKHVQTLDASFQLAIKDDGGETGRELMRSLDALIETFANGMKAGSDGNAG